MGMEVLGFGMFGKGKEVTYDSPTSLILLGGCVHYDLTNRSNDPLYSILPLYVLPTLSLSQV